MTTKPTYGVNLLAGSVEDVAEFSATAERRGFDAAWTSEFYSRSATITLAAMAQRTGSIQVGSAIAYATGRSPLLLAAEARDLDELSEGRLVLGLGTGTRRMIADWHGEDPSSPAVRVEELVPLLRSLWRLHEAPVEHSGRFYEVSIKATAEMLPPRRTEIPIYTAGVNPRMIETAGRVANGLIGHPLFTTSYIEEVVRVQIAKGAERTGRDPSRVALAGILICSVDEDVERARRRAAGQLAFYAAPKTYAPVLEVAGFSAEGEAIRAAFAAGDHRAMVAAVSDEMIDAMAVFGPPGEIRDRLDRYAGVLDHVVLYPPSWRMDEAEQRDAREALLELGLHLHEGRPDPGESGSGRG